MSVTEQIREKAKEVLESGQVACVIGYETGTDGLNARPAFIYSAAEVDRLVFDETCVHNLANYLPDRKGQSLAVILKPCDLRSLNVLVGENQVQREGLYAIGVTCCGMEERGGYQVRTGKQPARCASCDERTPLSCDYQIGEEVARTTNLAAPSSIAAGEDAESRARFWAAQFSRCIRCYACRNACPGCYCSECIVEQLDPEWVHIRIEAPQNQMFQMIRAFHQAGRCVGCQECERVCPMGLPLDLLNSQLREEVEDLFDFVPGRDPAACAPLETFRKEETLK